MLVIETGLKFSCLFSPEKGNCQPGGFKVGNKVYAEKSVLSSATLNLRALLFFGVLFWCCFFSLLTHSQGTQVPGSFEDFLFVRVALGGEVTAPATAPVPPVPR